MKLAKRIGGKKVRVAVARKIAMILHASGRTAQDPGGRERSRRLPEGPSLPGRQVTAITKMPLVCPRSISDHAVSDIALPHAIHHGGAIRPEEGHYLGD